MENEIISEEKKSPKENFFSSEFSEKPENFEKKESWFDVIRFIIITLAIVIPLRMFVIEPYMVRGDSMLPNFENNDYLLAEKWSSWKKIPDYKRGDIVIFKSPAENKRILIKRIIALPGETIKIENGKVSILKEKNNGEETNFIVLNEGYLNNSVINENPNSQFLPVNFKALVLKTDEFFVLGDNRGASYDSRFWGPLPAENIIGRPIMRLYRFNQIGVWPEFGKFDEKN